MTSIPPAALKWIVGGDTGLSSKTIWAVMMGQKSNASHPHDPSDLGRCLRLLAAVPEWKPRIGEMASVSPYWAALVSRWTELRDCMANEVGIDWSKGRAAKTTSSLMQSILKPVEASDRHILLRFGDDVTQQDDWQKSDDDGHPFRIWLRELEEDVIQFEFGYEPGEFTVFPEHWFPLYEQGLTPQAAWQRALDAFKAAR